MYDVVLNVSNRSVTIAPHASADFAFSAFVKDLATYLVDAAADPDLSDGDVIKGLASRTGELLKRVRSLAQPTQDGGDPVVSLDSIQQAGIQGALARFLHNVAVAENLTR